MPDYKKKHVNRLRGAPKPKRAKKTAENISQDIEMQPSPARAKRAKAEPAKNESPLKVVKGKKLERRRKTRIALSAAAVIIIAVTVLHLVLPVGIAENIGNLTALIGAGGYPVTLESSDTLNTVSRGGYYYVLSDTRLCAYSGGGKEIYSYMHGYENPVLKTSKTRALIFSQGGNEAAVYNLRSKKGTVKSNNEIITAGISDSGVYAVVTRSDKYASVVTAYDKRNKRIYEWSSATDTVNNVAVSPNGKKIAVSLFSAASGKFTSKISVLEFDSASPKYTDVIDGSLVYTLDGFHNSGFSALTENGYIFTEWSGFKKTEYKSDFSPAFLRSGSGGIAAVFNRESDRTDNRVVLFTKKGQVKSEFEFKGIISDIQVFGGHIYCISDTAVYLLSDSGGVLRKAECGFGAVRLAVLGSNTAAVITDNKIEIIKLEAEGE